MTGAVPGRPLRVAHLITRLEPGGAQRNTLHTVRHLDRERFQPWLLCGSGGELDGEAGQGDVPVTFVRSLVRTIDPLRDAATLARLTALWRRNRPDIVHTHSSKAGILGRLAAHGAGVPVVVHSIHGYGFHSEQAAVRRQALMAAERVVAPLTTHFIAVAERNRDLGIELGLFDASRVSLIRSGVDLARFRRAAGDRPGLWRDHGIPPRAPLVGMVACLKPQKAPLDYVEAARRVRIRLPDAHFLLVGDGVLRRPVEAAAAAAGLGGALHLLGWREDVDRLVASLDVLLHTARWEGLPRVFPEALAAGVPVVATDVDGAPDVVREGENGHLLPPGDVQGLADRVVDLLRDPVRRRRMSQAGLRDAEAFDIHRMVHCQESLYLRLWRRAVGEAVPAEEAGLAGSRA